MSVLTFVFDKAKTLIGGDAASAKQRGIGKSRIGVLEMDAVISETHSHKSDVTTLPVEKGGNITDHVVLQPKELTITGFITNSPVKVLGGASIATMAGSFLGGELKEGLGSAIGSVVGSLGGDLVSSAGNALGGAVGGSVGDLIKEYLGGASSSTDYVQNAYKQLMALRDNKTPITVQTGLNSYPNMLMTSLEIPRTKEVGEAIQFTIQMIQVRIVSSKEIDAAAEGVADQTASTTDTGKQTTTPAPESVENKVKDQLMSAVSNISGGE